jgi:site-specific DNA-adenine methylase
MKTYHGGKSGSGTYQTIINHIPPHDIYCEAFAGHGGIFRKIRRAAISVLNDKDADVMKLWKEQKFPGCEVYENFMQGNLFEKPTKPVVILRNNDYSAIIDKFGHNPDAFIYFDPPYLMNTRSHQRKLYHWEWETEEDHSLFLYRVSNVKSAAMISAYPNDMYNEALKGWQQHDFQSMTRGGLRTERIYYNYPTPAILHDYRYIGKDHRQRLDIKRKVARWNNRLATMKDVERTAILSNIINQFKSDAERLITL